MRNYLTWTEEMDAALRKAIGDNLSFTEAAKRLAERCGVTVSRNAVAGRVNRIMKGTTTSRAKMVAWTPEMVDALAAHRRDGTTYKDIARLMSAQFGVTLTVNGCSEVAKRKGIARRRSKAYAPSFKATTPGKKKPPNRRALSVYQDEPAPALSPDGKPYTILSLTKRTCTWPRSGSGADTTFCGHRVTCGGGSWCAYHRKRGFKNSAVSA